MKCKMTKTYKNYYGHVVGLAGGLVAVTAGIAVAILSSRKLGVCYGCECEAEYLNDLLYDEFGDKWDEHRINVNRQINKDFEYSKK